MSIAEEIQKLQTLHSSGAITDEEFTKAKEAALKGSSNLPSQNLEVGDTLRRLSRSSRDAWIGGVCGGLGQHSPIPSWAWRVIFLFVLLTFGVGLIPYVVLWICVPLDTAIS